MANENQTITWTAPEFRHYEKNLGWYVTFCAVAILIMGFFGIIETDWFAAICIGILTLLALFFATQRPQPVTVELDGKGLKFGTLFFPYKQLKDFWVVQNDRHRTLNFRTTTYVNNFLIVELEDQDGEQIRQFLRRHLPEHEEIHETMAQRISHKLKF